MEHTKKSRYPAWVERELRKNGFYNHSPKERTRRIKGALRKLDKAMHDVTLKKSAADYLER